MTKHLSDIKDKTIMMLLGMTVSLIVYIFISQVNSLNKLQDTIEKLQSTVAIFSAQLQVVEDRTQQHEIEIKRFLRNNHND